MLPPLCMLVSSLPRSRLDIRIGNVVDGNASSAGFLITRCLDGLPAGLAGLCIPKAKLELKLGVPGILFALLKGCALDAAECDCVLKCPLLNGLPVLGGRLRVVSQGRTGREGSVTRRIHGGFGGEDLGFGIEKFGILGMWWRVGVGVGGTGEASTMQSVGTLRGVGEGLKLSI